MNYRFGSVQFSVAEPEADDPLRSGSWQATVCPKSHVHFYIASRSYKDRQDFLDIQYDGTFY